MARRAWRELRGDLLQRVCGAEGAGRSGGRGGGFLRPLEVVQGTAEALHRLQSLEEQLKSSRTFWERAQLASVLDLGRRHREAAEQLSLAEAEAAEEVPSSSQKAAAALLGAMVQRHLRWEEQRSQRRRSAAWDLEILPGSTTREELRSFLAPGKERPFVLRGFQTPRWAPEDLREILGRRRVPIRRCEDASANWAAPLGSTNFSFSRGEQLDFSSNVSNRKTKTHSPPTAHPCAPLSHVLHTLPFVNQARAVCRLEFVTAVPFSDFYDEHIVPYLSEGMLAGMLAPRDSPQLFDHSIWQHCEDTRIGRELLMPSQVKTCLEMTPLNSRTLVSTLFGRVGSL